MAFLEGQPKIVIPPQLQKLLAAQKKALAKIKLPALPTMPGAKKKAKTKVKTFPPDLPSSAASDTYIKAWLLRHSELDPAKGRGFLTWSQSINGMTPENRRKMYEAYAKPSNGVIDIEKTTVISEPVVLPPEEQVPSTPISSVSSFPPDYYSTPSGAVEEVITLPTGEVVPVATATLGEGIPTWVILAAVGAALFIFTRKEKK